MTNTIDACPPARDSREYQIIRTLVEVENRGTVTGPDLGALQDLGIDIVGHFAYLYCKSDRAKVIEKMSLGEIHTNRFNYAVIHWANGYEIDEASKQKKRHPHPSQ